MTISITRPATGGSMGFGQRMDVHTTSAWDPTQVAVAQLLAYDTDINQLGLATGIAAVDPGTGHAEVIFGASHGTSGTLLPPPVMAGGVALGALVAVHVTIQNGGTPVEDATFADYYVHDPVSQAGYLVAQLLETALGGGGGSHDPMLDDILASVRKSYG